MNNPEGIQVRIEEIRQRLNIMAKHYDRLWNPKVIRLSMELDELINKHHKAILSLKEGKQS